MSKGLLLPKHVYESEKAKKPGAVDRLMARAQERKVELDIPPLVDLPWKPDKWLMVVSPVTISKVGNIMTTEQTQADQQWTQGVGRVMAVGPAVYKGRQFADKGLGPEDAPKVGDYVLYNAKSPLRFSFMDRVYITINDDATLGTVSDPELALSQIKFTI